MTYLSFASTLLSIVLSIFAIMYSFYSMQDASRKWNDVDKAVESIRNYTDNIQSNNQQLLDQVISINKNVSHMQGAYEGNNGINVQPISSEEITNISRNS